MDICERRQIFLSNIRDFDDELFTPNSLDWSEIMQEYKLENGKTKISELSNNELDKMIEHYKRKNKTKENILKMKRKKLNDSK